MSEGEQRRPKCPISQPPSPHSPSWAPVPHIAAPPPAPPAEQVRLLSGPPRVGQAGSPASAGTGAAPSLPSSPPLLAAALAPAGPGAAVAYTLLRLRSPQKLLWPVDLRSDFRHIDSWVVRSWPLDSHSTLLTCVTGDKSLGLPRPQFPGKTNGRTGLCSAHGPPWLPCPSDRRSGPGKGGVQA